MEHDAPAILRWTSIRRIRDNGGPWGVPDRRAVSGCGQCREPPLRAGTPAEVCCDGSGVCVTVAVWAFVLEDFCVRHESKPLRSLCKTAGHEMFLLGVLEDSSAII